MANTVRWPGHLPGRILLGWSDGGDLDSSVRETGSVGLRRSYFQWHQSDLELQRIDEDHQARRLPWVSFKPPLGADRAWALIATGQFDDEIRERARSYARLELPVIATFHHEPHNDARHGTAADFVAAWLRIHNVMTDETGLRNCAHVPIIGEWVWNPVNTGAEPDEFVPASVLDRCSFLGVDLYQNRGGEGYPERLGRIMTWLDQRARPEMMVGIGETGATDRWGSPTAAQWWRRSWTWAENQADRVGAIAYWNSDRVPEPDTWRLADSPGLLAEFRRSLRSTVAARSMSFS
jgi:hypothetical protein